MDAIVVLLPYLGVGLWCYLEHGKSRELLFPSIRWGDLIAHGILFVSTSWLWLRFSLWAHFG